MKTLAIPLLFGAAGAPLLAVDLTIDDVAPPQSVFVARVDDMSRTMEAFRATPMWTLATDPVVRDWFGIIGESFDENEIAGRLDRLGLEWDDVPLPTGHVGLALWSDERWSSDSPPVIIIADFGDGAEAFADIALDLFEQLETDGRLELAVEDYGPHEIYSLTFLPPEELVQQRAEQRERLMKQGWTEEDLKDAGMTPLEPGEGFFARAGGTVFFSSVLDRTQAALDAADGRDIESLAGDEAIALGRDRLGESHADVVLKAGTVLDSLLTDLRGLLLPPDAIAATGLREIGVVSTGVRFNTDEGQSVIDLFMQVDEPVGLFALPAPLNGFNPPRFLGPSPAGYTAIGVDWSRIIPVARQFVLALPQEARADAEAALTAFSIAAAPIFQSLAPEIHVATTITRPLAADSQANLFAVPVANEAAIVGAINQYAQGIGAQVREFLGHQIWQSPAMIGPPTAVGVGAGWAFIGPPAAVERAFRQLAAADDAALRLGDTPSFQLAASRTAPRALYYGYADTSQLLEYLQWTGENVDRVINAQFEGQPWQPEERFIRNMIEEAESSLWFRLLRALPVDAFNDALGAQAQEFRRIDDGYAGRWILLRPVR